MDTISEDHGRTADLLFNNFLSPDWATPTLQVKIHNALGPEQWHCIQGVIAEVKDLLVQLLNEITKSITIDVSAQRARWSFQLAPSVLYELRIQLTCSAELVTYF